MAIPLEDSYTDILGKAQRGLSLTDAQLAARSGVSESTVASVKSGNFDATAARALAQTLGLNADALVALAEGTYRPAEVSVAGLAGFTSPFGDMTVNSYVIGDPSTNEAAAFDTGADASEMLDFLREKNLTLKFLLITHTHGDHILELDRIVERTRVPVFVGNREPRLDGAEAFPAGKKFSIGSLSVDTRLTWGHAQGGITYVVHGLSRPVAVVGDAVFAGSMGGGMVSYADALRTNREEILTLPDATILASGHGPLTSVGEQKTSNPFLAI